MGLRENPLWQKYCQSNNRPSINGFIEWSNKIYAGEKSQEKQHENKIMVVTR